MKQPSNFQKNRLDYLLILLIIISAALTLFLRIGDVPPLFPWSDESEIAADAVATLKEGPRLFYPDQLAGGSLAVWLEAGWMALFGKGLLGLRIFNGLVNLASVLCLYLLVEHLPLQVQTRWLAFSAALLLAVSTWLLGLGRIATPNWSLVPLLTTLAFLFFWRGLNTARRIYFIATGVTLGLLFYGYIPGYFVPLIPALFLSLAWLTKHLPVLYRGPVSIYLPSNANILYLFLLMFIVAAPILIFFGLNPNATLQRPLQLVGTNELSAAAGLLRGSLDMLSTFGLWPNWLLQGRFEQLAFDPVVTVLFVVGLLTALWTWRNPAHLFLLLWWGVMIAPAILSRSASQGFIFEVWRRGIGAQPVSFILAALGLRAIVGLARRPNLSGTLREDLSGFRYGLSLLIALISATLGYWLYFGRWATSPAIPALFAEGPVQLVQWLETTSNAETLVLFPRRPNVSPTTRPDLFTVRYLYDGPATLAFPVLDEASIEQTLASLRRDHAARATIKLMRPVQIAVDPKGYFDYALARQGWAVAQEEVFGYTVTTYQTYAEAEPPPPFASRAVDFGGVLRLSGLQMSTEQPAAGQMLGVALPWLLPGEQAVDYTASLALYDSQNIEWSRVDKPLLSPGDYLTTRHWPARSETTLYYALPLPPDAPPGSYHLRLIVYNTNTGERLAPAPAQADLSFRLAEVMLKPNPTPVEVTTLPIAQPLDVDFLAGLHLAGLAVGGGATYRPGDTLPLSLWWQVQVPLLQEVGLVFALTVPEGNPVPLFDQPQPLLRDAKRPTPTWTSGQTYRANYPLFLPATLTSGEYGLALALFDLKTNELLAEHLLTSLVIESRPHIFAAPPLAQPRSTDFGDQIRLLGFEGQFSADGQEFKLKLQWQALRAMGGSYKMFVHLIDPNGHIISQLDTLPQAGAAPTPSWLPGEIIEETLSLPIPAETRPDAYRLVVGWYSQATGQRLPAGQNDQIVLIEQGNAP